MIIRCFSPHLDHSYSLIPPRIPSITRHDLRRRQRRSLPEFRCHFGFESLFSTLNSVSPLDLLAPAFGLASAATAVYLHLSLRPAEVITVVGDWILYTSPTPFNRCALLRCPSVSFEDGGELGNIVHDRLVREDRHYVNLFRGGIPLKDKCDAGFEKNFKFQRVCVRTDDGGVISMDWPDYLDLEREQGLDTTVLIIPGTPEGSMDIKVRFLVLDVAKNGCFPIVMNPRGCAGSALTTARLFTAADSDDVCTAVQFISQKRPWTTLMGIGWGYGANMLTKYLAESGETTPVTAAVCIDTPFDLDESTKSSPHNVALNEKLTSRLKEILRANKELFQGKTKGFDVVKALSATSVRDFDEAVSMISYGFDSLEDFYRKSSTRQLIDNLKIPILFIQTDGGTIPMFSIPRSSITDNPFTSLLLCSRSHSAIKRGDPSALIWSQQLAIEWLSAVEHALLKGRHPLLNDVDITIKPLKAFINVGARQKSVSASSKPHVNYDPCQLLSKHNHGNMGSIMKLKRSDAANGFLVYPCNTEVNGDDGALYDNAIDQGKLGNKFYEMQRDDELGTQDGKNEKHHTAKKIPTEGVANAINNEGSQVTQTATVIMNMLDVVMPSTLDDDQKKKVLGAMEQGETFMKALQGAVPEDARGKMTTVVTEIIQNQGTNLNLEAFKKLGWIPNLTSNFKSKIQGKNIGTSQSELGYDDGPLEQRKVGISNGVGSEGNNGPSQEKDSRSYESTEVGSEMEDKANPLNESDQVGGVSNENSGSEYEVTEKCNAFDKKCNQNQVVGDDVSNANDCEVDSLSEPSISSSTNSEESSSAGSSAHQVPVDGNGSQKKGKNDGASQNIKPSSNLEDYSSPQSHSISVSQALDALTGFDDSTQMAVNSVFGVIENIIDQLEKSNQEGDDVVKKIEDQISTEGFNDIPLRNGEKSNKFAYANNGSGIEPGLSQPAIQPENPFNVGIETYEHKMDKFGYSMVNFSPAPTSDKIIKQFEEVDFETSQLNSSDLRKYGDTTDLTLDAVMKRYWPSPYATFLKRYFTPLPSQRSLDVERATDLLLDPEEGQWKMIDQPSSSIITTGLNGKDQNVNFASGQRDVASVIEPSYVILDAEYSKCNYEFFKEDDDINDDEQEDLMKEKFFFLIKNTLLDDLKVEVGRRISTPDLEEFDNLLAYDLENFTDKVSRDLVSYGDLNSFEGTIGAKSMKFGIVEGQQIVEIISSALQDANHLRKVIPFGVIVGSSLASLRTCYQVIASHDVTKDAISRPVNMQQMFHGHESDMKDEHLVAEKLDKDENDHHLDSNKSIYQENKELETVGLTNGGIMICAVTAALGTSALLASHQMKLHKKDETEETSDYSNKSLFTDDEIVQEKKQNNLVSSLAEKAMSVTGPVVPTKSDGEVDHERLVAILAELGQKGGALRLVGKVALLWGGIRGAMSLTDRLISFLHIAERPLFQRVIGFVCMVLVLWSPVLIPLLPTLVQSWTTHNPNKIAEFVCIAGLYIASIFLVILWGKRIRGYDNPIEHYGLDLTSLPRVLDFIKGLVGGIMIVSCIHLVNALLGYVSFSWTSKLPSSSSRPIVLLRAYGSLLLLTVQGIVCATGISVVEELLFRSWLAEELAADLGYYRAIMISGLMFAVIQRSLPSVPGFLLMSICLFGIKQRANGKLAAPVGVRAGLIAANFIIQNGALLSYTYRAVTPSWLASTHPWHPLDGAVGIILSSLLAIFFFPKPPHKISRPIRD